MLSDSLDKLKPNFVLLATDSTVLKFYKISGIQKSLPETSEGGVYNVISKDPGFLEVICTVGVLQGAGGLEPMACGQSNL